MSNAYITTSTMRALASSHAAEAEPEKKQVDLSETLKLSAGSSFAGCLQGLGLDDWGLILKGVGTLAAIVFFTWAIFGIFAWTADLANQPSPAAAVYRVR